MTVKFFSNYISVMDCLAALERYLPSVTVQHLIRKQHNNKDTSSGHRLLLPSSQEDLFDAVCLVCDVSRLVKQLESDVTLVKKRTTAGVEEEKEEPLIGHLNTCFGQLMRIVSNEGGEVFKFAGDVMIALWPPPSTLLKEEECEGDKEGGFTSMERRARSAARCAFSMLEELLSYNLIAVNKAVPQLMIGIGIGEVSILHLGGVLGRVEYVAVGDALVQSFKALHYAKPGYVSTSDRLGGMVREEFSMRKEPFLEEGYVVLNELPAHHRSPMVNRNMGLYITQKDHRHIMSDLELEKLMKSYVPEPILYHHEFRLDLVEDEYWYNEIRPISVLSASLGLGEDHHLSAVSFCDKAMMEVHNAMVEAAQECILYRGTINKIVMDDKRCTLLAVCGLPGAEHSNGPIHATLAALRLCEKLSGLKLIGSFGVTTGETFCGLVGSKTRREYVTIGDTINRGAALMQVALAEGGGVLCDEVTMKACQGVLDFVAKGKCEVEGNHDKMMTIDVFQPYPSEFSAISPPNLFGSDKFRSIYNQGMKNFVLHETLSSLKMYFNILREGSCSPVPCTELSDISLQKSEKSPGNVPIDIGGKEIFCASVINGLRTKFVVVSSLPVVGSLDRREYWKIEDAVLLIPDTRQIECNGTTCSLEKHNPQQICEVVDADDDHHGSTGLRTYQILETSNPSLVTKCTDIEKAEKMSSQNVQTVNVQPDHAACTDGTRQQVPALQMGIMNYESQQRSIEGGDGFASSLRKEKPSPALSSGCTSSSSTSIQSPHGSESVPATSPDLANVRKENIHHKLSQCGLIPISYIQNKRTLESLSMASILHALKMFPSSLKQNEERETFLESELEESVGGGTRCLTDLLQVLNNKMSLSVENMLGQHQFDKPVNEWFCSIAVPVDGNIRNLNVSDPRMLIRCDSVKTTMELIDKACTLAASEGFLSTSPGPSNMFCLNIQGTRAFLPLYDSMPMDTRLLPSIVKEVCIGRIHRMRSMKKNTCVQPLCQCGVIELVLARIDSTADMFSRCMHAQLVLLQMKASLVLEHKGGVVLLEGAPGVGKTNLLSRFAAKTLPQTTSVHFTASSPFGYGGGPYDPWGALLGQLLDISAQNQDCSAAAASYDGLAEENVTDSHSTSTLREQALLKELQGYPSLLMRAYLVNDILGTAIPKPDNERDGENISVESSRKWTLEILLHLLRCMSEHQKMLMIIDDAHYLDQDSWELLLQSMSLGPNNDPLPMLIVLAFRPLSIYKGLFPSMPSAASKLLLQNRGAIFLKVDGLRHEEVEHLVINQLGAASVTSDLLVAVEELCLGNPFVIMELIGHLKKVSTPCLSHVNVENEEGGEGGLAVTLTDGWNSSLLPPPNRVTTFILDILGHINSIHLLILKTASVMGKEFSLRLLFEVYPINEHLCTLGTELDAIEELGLLASIVKTSPNPKTHSNAGPREDGKCNKVFRFTYGFMREVLQSTMTLSHRIQLENRFRVAVECIEKVVVPEGIEALKSYPKEQEPVSMDQLKILKQEANKRVMRHENGPSSVGHRLFHLHFERRMNHRDWATRTCLLSRNCLYVFQHTRNGKYKSVSVLHLSWSSTVEKMEECSAPRWMVESFPVEPMFCVQTLHWIIGGIEHKDEKQMFFFIAESKEAALRWIRLISYVISESVELSVNLEFLQGRQSKQEKSRWQKVVEVCKKRFQIDVDPRFVSPVMLRKQLQPELCNPMYVLVVLVKRVEGSFLLRDGVGRPAYFCGLKIDNILKRTFCRSCSFVPNSHGRRYVFHDYPVPPLGVKEDDVNCTCATVEWMEEVSFVVSLEQLKTSVLCIEVFREDIILSNDYLGLATLRLSNLQQNACSTDMVPRWLKLTSGSGGILEIGWQLMVPALIREHVKLDDDFFSSISSNNMVELFEPDYSDSSTCESKSPSLLYIGSNKSRKMVKSGDIPTKSKLVTLESVVTGSGMTRSLSSSVFLSCGNQSNELGINSPYSMNYGLNVNWTIKDKHPLLDRIFILDDPLIAAQDRYLLKGWEFDIFTLECEEIPLFLATMFAQTCLPRIFSIPTEVFGNFLYATQRMMSRQPHATYHSDVHAADIMHATWIILYHRGTELIDRLKCPLNPTGLSPIGDLALLIAALCHDLDHPGLSNTYHIKIGTTLGINYGDASPLEKHHYAIAWSILRNPECNIFLNLTPDELMKARSVMYTAILMTDMQYHTVNETAMQKLMVSVPHPLDEPPASLSAEVVRTCARVILHAADISSAGRPWKTCSRWVELLYIEFNVQAKKEKEANLGISVVHGSYCDHQPSFLEFISPYFDSLDRMVPNVMEPWLKAMKRNKMLWIEECKVKTKHEEDEPSAPSSTKV